MRTRLPSPPGRVWLPGRGVTVAPSKVYPVKVNVQLLLPEVVTDRTVLKLKLLPPEPGHLQLAPALTTGPEMDVAKAGAATDTAMTGRLHAAPRATVRLE